MSQSYARVQNKQKLKPQKILNLQFYVLIEMEIDYFRMETISPALEILFK